MSEESHVTIKVPKELVAEMDRLIGTHGFRSRGEITKEALRRLLKEYREVIESTIPLRFEHFNMGMDGVRVVDHKLNRIADVYFRPEGIWCDFDKKSKCEHIDFALSIPKIQGIIEKRKKEGWKLPDV